MSLDTRLVAIDDLDARVPVVVGCSGGADSLALLALMRARGFDVVAVYVDHGLRAGTERDARVVANACARLGAVARVERVVVEPGGNLEARARDARYAALEQVRAEVSAQAIAVAHTLDDQAETVLLNFLRGSGTTGLAGMSDRRGWVRRPLLELRRADTLECCARLGLAPVTDPMNSDVRHRRVWLRREVIPELERGARRDLVPVLARQAELFRADDDLLAALAAERATDDVAELAAMPVALARRVVRSWLATNSSDGRPPSRAAVERVLAVARHETIAAELPGGDRVIRSAGHLHRTPPLDSSSRVEDSSDESSTRTAEQRARSGGACPPVPLAVPGRGEFGGITVETWIEHAPPAAWPDGRFDAVCDADAVQDRLDEFVIRAPEPGERFRPLGRSGSKPIRTALAEAGVPSAARETAPVVAAGGPVWVVGYRIDHRVRVTASTRRFLWLSVERAGNP